MIKTIAFDLGGVILTIDQKEAVRRFRDLGLKDAESQLDPYTQSGIFGDLEAGAISAGDFRRELSRMIGRDLTLDECRYAWLGYAKELPQEGLRTLLRLREEGYRLLLLSNTNPFMMSWAESSAFDGHGHPLSYYFDATYKSYEMKRMKPDPAFFRDVLAREKLVPGEMLFVDDGPRNTAVASQLGMRTFCPENGSDWTKKIEDYLK